MASREYGIIGGGLAGTALALELQSRGKSVILFDAASPKAASRVAAGIFNPLTGRRLVKTWLADALHPAAWAFYRGWEAILDACFFHELPVVRLYHNEQQKTEWLERLDQMDCGPYLKRFVEGDTVNPAVQDELGGIETAHSWRLDIPVFLAAAHAWLKKQGLLIESSMPYSQIEPKEESVWLAKSMEVQKLVFAEGATVSQNPWFGYLRQSPNKGEVFIIEAPELELSQIISKGIFILPLGKGRFKVGATYDKENLDGLPSEKGRQKLLDGLEKALKVPFKVLEHQAGIRPSTPDRRPMLGQHPEHKSFYLFNGLGSKGASLAPYFAKHLSDHLIDSKELMAEASIARYQQKTEAT